MAYTRRDRRRLVLIVMALVAVGVVAVGSRYFGVDIGRFFAAAPPGLAQPGFVKVQGTKLTLNGKPWFSKGANWVAVRYPVADWLANPNAGAVPPGFLDADGFDPVKLDKELFQLHEMLDINTLRMEGPIGLDADGNWKPGYEDRVRQFVRLAYKNGMRINWALFFGVPGFQCPQKDGTTVPCNMFGKPDIGGAVLMPPGSEDANKRLRAASTFVTALKNEPGVLSYEVGNELLLNGTVRAPGYQEQVLSYIKRILDEVRRNDKNHFTVSGEVAVVIGPNDNRWPWMQGKTVEFVKFDDVHHLNGGNPFSLYDVVDVLGPHVYQPPEDVRLAMDIYAVNSAKPVVFGEYGGGGLQGHTILAEPVEQGRWHAAILVEARRRFAGAWVWNPQPVVDLKPGTYRIDTWQSNSGLRPIFVSLGPPERRLKVLSMQHWILRYQDNALNPMAMTPASLALANRQAVFVSQDTPKTMVAGHTYTVHMSWRNTGDGSWDVAGTPGDYGYAFRIKSYNPPDNLNFGVNFEPIQQAPIAPGALATFTFTVTAPAKPGTYNFQWRMNQGLVGWFGQTSSNVPVRVVQ